MASASIAPRLQVLGVEAFEQPYRHRLPFRFGVVTVTEGVQAFVRAHVRLDDGREGFGYAAEALAPKWFDKDPALDDEQNQHQLRKRARDRDRGLPRRRRRRRAFDLTPTTTGGRCARGASSACRRWSPATASALLDRAVLDARLPPARRGFWSAMRSNSPAWSPHPILRRPRQLRLRRLPRRPRSRRAASRRGTRSACVDPIVAADQPRRQPRRRRPAGDARGGRRALRPARLQAEGERRPARRHRAAVAHRRRARPVDGPLHVTLDGNEQYDDVEAVVELWSAMEAAPALQRLVRVDALHRAADQARRSRCRAASPRWPRHRPVIIDESDGEIDAFVRARALGYAGVSSKACKGFYKSLVNLARCRALERRGRRRLLPVRRGPDDAGGPRRAAGPRPRVAARPGRRRAQRPPFHRRLRRPAGAPRPRPSCTRIPTSTTRRRAAAFAWRSDAGQLDLRSLDVPGLRHGGRARPLDHRADAEGGLADRQLRDRRRRAHAAMTPTTQQETRR